MAILHAIHLQSHHQQRKIIRPPCTKLDVSLLNYPAASPLPMLVRQPMKFSATYLEFALIACNGTNCTPTEKKNSCKKDQCTSLSIAQFLANLLIVPYFFSSFSLEP